MKQYTIDVVERENTFKENEYLYTFNVYRKMLFGVLYISVYTITETDFNAAIKQCIEYIKSVNGELV